MSTVAESTVEEAALGWLESLGYQTLFGPAVAPGEPQAERHDFREVVLRKRLRDAIDRLNPSVRQAAKDDAIRRLLTIDSPSLIGANRLFHRMLVDGVTVEEKRPDGTIAGVQIKVIDFDDPDNNDFLAVNQFSIIEGQYTRRPDIVIFVNGLPLAVIELKNPTDEQATIWTAYNQLQTYKQQIRSLFTYNEALIISDGIKARIGTLTSDKERFSPWRTIEGDSIAPATSLQLDVMLRGAFDKRRLLDLIRYFVVFEDDGKSVFKKMAAYHQFHAVGAAIRETLRATRLYPGKSFAEERPGYRTRKGPVGRPGDHRVGVVWHTQGSGKSLTMAFYVGRLVVEEALQNPTVVVVTDRNDLDGQLFGTFSRCHELLRQAPVQAEDREHLRDLLKVASGGVVFTTAQKFIPDEKGASHPLLTNRSNVVVIADEAHRTQYDFIDGFARRIREALPNASYIGFTGTPVELTDRSTLAVFGDYISIYDIQQAVADGATVPIYYEGRLAELKLDEREKPKIDPEFEEVTEGEEASSREALKSKWAALESVVGAEKRVELIAEDLVSHFEKRLEAMDGKAMVVCMSRRICVDLYNAIVRLRPQWHDDSDERGAIKVVMTGSASDKIELQPHIRSKKRRDDLADRFRDPTDQLKIVIVRDMWLTGFDAPCLHTMYVDKPMQGHGLMQAIARVNRVFRDKPGGLIVDYLGLADQLQKALGNYTEGGGKGKATFDQAEAIAVMLTKYEICCDLFFGFDRRLWKEGTPAQKLGLLPAAQEHILSQEDGKERLLKAVGDLTKAFALSVPSDEAMRIVDDVAFFQAVRSAIAKTTGTSGQSADEMEGAIRQIISRAIAPDGVVDIFTAAGLKRPDISILSDEFLAEVRDLPQKNLAVELLRRLLTDDLKMRQRHNLIQSRSFLSMLEQALKKYRNRTIETAQIIEELIRLAKEMREAAKRGESLGLSDDELAFYDALEVNDSAVKVLGDPTLKGIARDLVDTVRRNATIDWTVRESARANLRRLVKRTLRKYGYPPDKQELATKTVLEQAELLCADWAA